MTKNTKAIEQVELAVNGITAPATSDKAQGAEYDHPSLPPVDPDDAWDLEALRLPQDVDLGLGGQKLLVTVPVRKPQRQEYVRVRPEESWRFLTALLTSDEERESYLVAPLLWDELAADIQRTVLFTAINRQNILFLWPVRLVTADRKASAWQTSALTAAQQAVHRWIRLSANMPLGAYDIYVAGNELPEPEWPTDITFAEVMKLAFKDKRITDVSHPVVRRLRGEI
jgi:hypothetical protein